MESCPAKTIEHACLAMRDRPDFSGDLASIAVPTLIIVGEKDAITPPAMSESMHRAIPRSQLVVISKSGHMTPMETPDDVNRALREFLA
jgi:pimeloyl-ACP methyl ester carboxylesterase